MGVAGFQRDGQTENLADAGQFLQALVGGPFPDDAQDVLLQLHDRVGEVAHQDNLLAAQELVGGFGEAGLGFLGLHGFDAGQRHTLAEGALVQALEAQDQRRPLAHQQQAAAQEVAAAPESAPAPPKTDSAKTLWLPDDQYAQVQTVDLTVKTPQEIGDLWNSGVLGQ